MTSRSRVIESFLRIAMTSFILLIIRARLSRSVVLQTQLPDAREQNEREEARRATLHGIFKFVLFARARPGPTVRHNEQFMPRDFI